jgi:hypothetical protein
MSSFKYPESIIVRLNEKYGLYYRNNLVLKCEYDDLKINTPFAHNGKYGLVLEDGTIAVDFIYDLIEPYNGYFFVVKNGKYGVYDNKQQRIDNYWTDTKESICKYIDAISYDPTYIRFTPLNIKF